MVYIESLSRTNNYGELYHHGIKGMKWGVRRFQNEDGSYTGAGKKRYGIGDRINTRIRSAIQTSHMIRQRTAKAKGLGNKFSERFGNGRARTISENRAKMEAKLAEQSNTRLGKRLHSVRSFNQNSLSKYYDKRSRMTLGERTVSTLLGDPDFMSIKVQRLSGRKTTVGRMMVDTLLTGGVAGGILDMHHIVKTGGKY